MSTPSDNMPKGNRSGGNSQSGNRGQSGMSGNMQQTGSQDPAQQAKDTAKQAVQAAKEKTTEVAGEITEKVKQTASDVRHEVTEQVSDTVDEARRKVEQSASAQKSQLADRIGGVADALHQAGDHLERNQENHLGSYADSAAEQLTGLSNYLRDHDLNQILDDARGFARQQPEIFYTGALVAGFLAGRFFRSSSSQGSFGPNDRRNFNPNYSADYRRSYQGGYGGSYDQDYGPSYGQRQGASYGQGYGPTSAAGSDRRESPRPIPVSGPKGDAKTEEVVSGQVATAWTPAEQALHARSDEE